MTLESLTDRRIRDLIDQRDKAEAVAHILQGQLTERTRERDSARDLALVLEEVNEKALRLHVSRPVSPGQLYCNSCLEVYPCPTRRALTGSDSPEVA